MATMGGTRARSSSWQERLQDHCRSSQLHPPVFNIVSDRRGGRTAWSSTCTIPSPSSPTAQQTVQARFWYDGQYVNNAKEDAAEVALRVLTGGSSTGPASPASPTSSAGNPWPRPPGAASASGSSSSSSMPHMGGNVGIGAAWPRSPPPGRW